MLNFELELTMKLDDDLKIQYRETESLDNIFNSPQVKLLMVKISHNQSCNKKEMKANNLDWG